MTRVEAKRIRPHIGQKSKTLSVPSTRLRSPVLGQLVGDAQQGRLDALIVERTDMPGRKIAGQPSVVGVLTRLVESGRRESNSHDQLGRLVAHS